MRGPSHVVPPSLFGLSDVILFTAATLLAELFRSTISPDSRDRLVVRTLRCGRNNPGSNPGTALLLYATLKIAKDAESLMNFGLSSQIRDITTLGFSWNKKDNKWFGEGENTPQQSSTLLLETASSSGRKEEVDQSPNHQDFLEEDTAQRSRQQEVSTSERFRKGFERAPSLNSRVSRGVLHIHLCELQQDRRPESLREIFTLSST
ncbi:hypothetical protein J6590_059941 [Homalodisca vitripennis]|nr:hypothetical protein J6590_059941 [Homalodisca vitripennis]